MLLHVRAVGVCDGDVVGELGGAEHAALAPRRGACKHALRRVGQAAQHQLVVVFLERRRVGVAVAWIVRVWHGRAFLQRHDHAARLGAVQHADQLGRQPHPDTPGLHIFAPRGVELAEVREHDHGRVVRHDTALVVGVPHAVGGRRDEPLQHDGGDIGRLVARAQKQRDHGQRDRVGELLGEEPQLEEDAQRDEGKENLKPAHELQRKAQAPHLALMSRDQVCREHVRPERLALAERHLQIHRVGVEALPREHGQRVVEDVAPALHALVEPAGPVPVLVQRAREGLSAAVVHRVDQRDIVFFRVLG